MTLSPLDPDKMNEIVDTVSKEGIYTKRDASLKEYATFRLGGKCPCLIGCERPLDVIVVIQELAAKSVDFILIGGGSNLLISDEGTTSIVVRYCSSNPLISRDADRQSTSTYL